MTKPRTASTNGSPALSPPGFQAPDEHGARLCKNEHVDDGGLGEQLDVARALEAQIARRPADTTRRNELDGEVAYRQVTAAGRAFVSKAQEIGLEIGEFSIRSERPKRFSRTPETVWTTVPVYVVGGLHKIYVDPDGVVYSPRPTKDCEFGPHNLHSGMATIIVQEMAAYLASAERDHGELVQDEHPDEQTNEHSGP